MLLLWGQGWGKSAAKWNWSIGVMEADIQQSSQPLSRSTIVSKLFLTADPCSLWYLALFTARNVFFSRLVSPRAYLTLIYRTYYWYSEGRWVQVGWYERYVFLVGHLLPFFCNLSLCRRYGLLVDVPIAHTCDEEGWPRLGSTFLALTAHNWKDSSFQFCNI